jgi:hypothetical protein
MLETSAETRSADGRRVVALCGTGREPLHDRQGPIVHWYGVLVGGNPRVQTCSGHPLKRTNVGLVPSQPNGATGLTAESGR